MAMSFTASDESNSSSVVGLDRNEALHNCFDKTWCSLLCFCALSTVTFTNKFSHLPDFGEIQESVFNSKIEPITAMPLCKTKSFCTFIFWS